MSSNKEDFWIYTRAFCKSQKYYTLHNLHNCFASSKVKVFIEKLARFLVWNTVNKNERVSNISLFKFLLLKQNLIIISTFRETAIRDSCTWGFSVDLCKNIDLLLLCYWRQIIFCCFKVQCEIFLISVIKGYSCLKRNLKRGWYYAGVEKNGGSWGMTRWQ